MDSFRIDNHKLIFHPERVASWRNGEDIFPIYMEISPVGLCNHRCIFCGLDFMHYQNRKIEKDVFFRFCDEVAKAGVKSFMFAGEGEPLLHKNIIEMNSKAAEVGIDTAFTTNAVMLTPSTAEKILPHTKWIKVSFNAGTKETYAKLHRCKENDFDTVFENLEHACRFRKENNIRCALGMQIILLPENQNEVELLARRARETGLDYLVVKPYSQHNLSETQQYANIRYSQIDELVDKLAEYNSESFNVIFRKETIANWNQQTHRYRKCLALPFWSYLDAGGNIWGCSMYLTNERFRYGNINENSFHEIWTSEKRKESLRFIREELDVSLCRVNCRMDKINEYLWELQNPGEHVNFI